jgi:hypothetical protein
LQADFAVCDQASGAVGDVDAPQLVGAALAEGYGFDGDDARGERAQEVGRVGQPYGDRPADLDGGAGPRLAALSIAVL